MFQSKSHIANMQNTDWNEFQTSAEVDGIGSAVVPQLRKQTEQVIF